MVFYQEVVGETPHPPVSQDCPEHQCVAQDRDHLHLQLQPIFLKLLANNSHQHQVRRVGLLLYCVDKKLTNIIEKAAVQM